MFKDILGIGEVMKRAEREGFVSLYYDMKQEQAIARSGDYVGDPELGVLFCGYATNRMTADEIVGMIVARRNNYLALLHRNGVR